MITPESEGAQAPGKIVTRWDENGYVIPTNPSEDQTSSGKSPIEIAQEFDRAVHAAAKNDDLSPVEIATLGGLPK